MKKLVLVAGYVFRDEIKARVQTAVEGAPETDIYQTLKQKLEKLGEGDNLHLFQPDEG
jgi:hypothetical protein